MSHAHADGIRHRIGHSCERGHDRGFTNTAYTIGVVGVGDFKDHRVNEGQIRADGNAVIEEARILQAAIFAVDIFFIRAQPIPWAAPP